MNSHKDVTHPRVLSSQFRRQAATAIAEFEGAIRDLSEDGDDAQRERMQSAAEAIMIVSARILIELE
jgi:hypothetical protein